MCQYLNKIKVYINLIRQVYLFSNKHWIMNLYNIIKINTNELLFGMFELLNDVFFFLSNSFDWSHKLERVIKRIQISIEIIGGA